MYNLLKKDFGNGSFQYIYYKHPIGKLDIDTEYAETDIIDTLDLSNYEDKKYFDFLQENKEKARLHSQFNNNVRAKKIVYDLARSNHWEYFVTFTFSPEKVEDRTDYKLVKKKLTTWLNNVSKRYCNGKLMYLAVPETHKKIEHNGLRAWHFHALMFNLGNLHLDDTGIVQDGYKVYNLREYKLGYSTLTKVVSSEKVSKYITKYMTKSISVHLVGQKRYLCSTNLNRPIVEKTMIEKKDFDVMMDKLNVVWQKDKEYKFNNFENTMYIREIKKEICDDKRRTNT
jgi:hypothetical protein